jgi:hypothetical protein
MRLRDAMFAGRIAWLALFGAELPLTRRPALELRLDFSSAALFEGIGAASGECREKDREEERPTLHPLILGNNDLIANS